MGITTAIKRGQNRLGNIKVAKSDFIFFSSVSSSRLIIGISSCSGVWGISAVDDAVFSGDSR